jgi:hypothetical protein
MTLQPQVDARPGGPVGKTSAQPGTRISCHAAPDEAARAPFSKGRRMKLAKVSKFHRKSGEGLGDGSPRLWSAGGAALPTFRVPRLRRSDDVAESMSQPSRAELKFGYRPSGPGSDLWFIAGYHTHSAGLGINPRRSERRRRGTKPVSLGGSRPVPACRGGTCTSLSPAHAKTQPLV